MFLALTWRDHRLRLPRDPHCWEADYRILDVAWIQHIWRPDCIFKNAKEIDFQVSGTKSLSLSIDELISDKMGTVSMNRTKLFCVASCNYLQPPYSLFLVV